MGLVLPLLSSAAYASLARVSVFGSGQKYEIVWRYMEI